MNKFVHSRVLFCKFAVSHGRFVSSPYKVAEMCLRYNVFCSGGLKPSPTTVQFILSEAVGFCVAVRLLGASGRPRPTTAAVYFREIKTGGARSRTAVLGPSAALKVHRTFIHFRLARFAYPPLHGCRIYLW